MAKRKESKSCARRHCFAEARRFTKAKTSFVEAKEGLKEDYSRVRLGKPNLRRGEGVRLGEACLRQGGGPICQKKTCALFQGE